MAENSTTLYDQVEYPGGPFAQTHPDRLSTIGSLFGMRPAPPTNCSVLELGGGDGGNLIPMAYQLPESRFYCLDLSEIAIAQGKQRAERLGLRNIEFKQQNIMDVAADLGPFDYIIAHGVYSWVPEFVQAKLMEILRDSLAPQGVGYISYNAYPGSHMRDVGREMMIYHTRHLDNPREAIQQSRALLKTLAEVVPDDAYGAVVRNRAEHVGELRDAVLYHDDLNPYARAFFLHEVCTAAEQHGLKYLFDAAFASSSYGRLSERVLNVLQQIPQAAIVGREQYLDFCVGRAFRQSLFCRKDVALQRELARDIVRNYHLAALVEPFQEEPDLSRGHAVSFKLTEDRETTTDHPLSKAAFLSLQAAWPQAVHFRDLLPSALQRLANAGVPLGDNPDEEVAALCHVLFSAYRSDMIELHLHPLPLASEISERPEASEVARTDAAASEMTVNLRHGCVWLQDPFVRQFIQLVDGTRTVDQLADEMSVTLLAPEERAGNSPEALAVVREGVHANLNILAKLGLLHA
jgi:SAM-dependent methyltransferase